MNNKSALIFNSNIDSLESRNFFASFAVRVLEKLSNEVILKALVNIVFS